MLREIIISWKSSFVGYNPALRHAHEVLKRYPEARTVIVSSASISRRLLVVWWIVSIPTLLVTTTILQCGNNIVDKDDEFWERLSSLENHTVGGESVSRGEKEFKKNQ
ncbi:hypothetical protein DCAR_0730178 [Daucus carota subsp. sativus]|uniref:Transmembrane protein n=1 Tax=Daucus carota subsp. sativus TaxID=79200 RepID=A0A164UQ47_DAUCS|nr:PREDICTED: uncharacterized protein LOC108195586 [Daucus carota subsp. sativus]WOH10708.1 hypothetical protein DCAR_0730178 [Daucus carota subsp. sativus]